MILADKIILLRKKNGWSQEELAGRLSVSRQSVSKWEGGQSIPDLDKLLALSKLFGVTVDYLVRDEMDEGLIEYTAGDSGPEEQEALPKVTVEEANRFLEERVRASGQIALGASLCILSPILLMLLCAMAETGRISVTENMAAGVGVAFLLLLIAAAVPIFILNDHRLEKYEYIEKREFLTEYGVEGIARDRKEKFAGKFSGGIALGVVLILLGIVPLVLAGGMGASDLVCTALVCVLLFLISAAVNRIVRVCMVQESFNQLLQEGDYSRRAKRLNPLNELVGSVYWSLITAVYLAVSFYTGRWESTWIIWPVAGVAFAAVIGILNIFRRDK